MSKQPRPIGFFEMVRDIFREAMRKGLLVPAVLGLCAVLWFARAPQEALGELPRQINHTIESFCWTGWVFSLVLAILWFKHSRWQRKIISDEMERIGKGKTALQEEILKRKLGSSDK